MCLSYCFSRCVVEGCGKAFITAFKLKRHETIHGLGKKYKCPYCKYNYPTAIISLSNSIYTIIIVSKYLLVLEIGVEIDI